jgi:predicted DNA-binding protein (MmcQ/YjbR family)
MQIDWLRDFCLSLPHTTEKVQWEDDLVFKIGHKMYAVVALEPRQYCMSLKCSDEDFAALIERPGVVPAPYLARAHWVALETDTAIPRDELKMLLRRAYDLVLAKLPKRIQSGRSAPVPRKKRRPTRKPRSRRRK